MKKKTLFSFLISFVFLALVTCVYPEQISYNQQATVDYAKDWCDKRNTSGKDVYYKYEKDCANFVSQCLIKGGLDLTDCTIQYVKDSTDKKGCIYRCTALHQYLKLWLNNVRYQYRPRGEGEPDWFAPGDIAIFGKKLGEPGDLGVWQHAVFAVKRNANGKVLCAAHTTDTCGSTIDALSISGEWNYCHFYKIEPTVKVDFATALIIDKSGSMSGEKIRRVKDAAYGYVDVCRTDQDLVSLAAFASNAESICQPTSIEQGRATLKSDILSVSAGGSTNIGSGLEVAYSHLSSSNSKNKLAILMSDGRHNRGTYKPETQKFINANWPVYTVAFGTDADQDTLREIAGETKGLSFSSDVKDIVAIYNEIHIQAHGGSVMYSYNDFIKPGQTLSYQVPIDQEMETMGFFTNWQGSRMETTLISPSGQELNRLNFSQRGRFREENTYTFFEMDNPEPGEWKIKIVGYDLPRSGEQINFHSFCKSDIFSNILGFQPNYNRNQKVHVGVKLAEVVDDNLVPLRGAKVTAEIKKPSTSLRKLVERKVSNVRNLSNMQAKDLIEIAKEISSLTKKIDLYDDGNHGDNNAGDGIYANTYSDNTINGPYIVTVDFHGAMSQGKSVSRTLQESFQVGPIEQNPFTVSEFLFLLAQKTISDDIPLIREIDKKKNKNVIDSIFDIFK